MSGPVDVRAVLRRHEAERSRELQMLRDEIDAGGVDSYDTELSDLTSWHADAVEASAAVAELIATLGSTREVLATALRSAAPDFFKTEEDIREHIQIKRIDAALASQEG